MRSAASRLPEEPVVCSACHEPISQGRLDEYPTASICLECMSPGEREALERDLESASRVQRTLLPPRSFEQNGWEIEYLWEPHGAVSGDHVDLMAPSAEGEPLHLLLGDVAGKGLSASLLQSQLHALFRALAPVEQSLAGLLRRINRLFFEATMPSCFATLTAVQLHDDGRIAVANAGHPRPLLADRRGVRPIEDASIPLGVLDEAKYEERELTLQPGETLLLYTDGLNEAESDGEEYGVGRAAAALRRSRQLPLAELLAACRNDLSEFLGETSRGDDLTMVAVRRSIAVSPD